MEEKIKIYIPDSVNNILLKDMERFEFFKKDLRYFELYLDSLLDMTPNVKEAILTMVCAIKTKQ